MSRIYFRRKECKNAFITVSVVDSFRDPIDLITTPRLYDFFTDHGEVRFRREHWDSLFEVYAPKKALWVLIEDPFYQYNLYVTKDFLIKPYKHEISLPLGKNLTTNFSVMLQEAYNTIC